MKHQFLTIATCALLLLAAGCKKSEQEPTPQPQPDPNPQPVVNLAADVARPEWVAPVDYDYTSSMTAVICVDLKAQYPDAAKDFELKDDDLIAAFIGDECLGVASPDDGLFYLYIASPTSNSDSGLTGEASLISIRYYSAHYKNLFVAKDAFPFVNDDQQGTYNAPFVPTLVVVTD